MNETAASLGTIAEVFTWLGVVIGMTLLLLVWIIRAARGPWHPITAVVVEAEVRWMTDAGVFYSRTLSDHERESLGEEPAFHSRRSQRDVHLEPVAHDERMLFVLGLVFVGIGIVAFVASFVVLFL